jgi:integrase/recombinase XerD
MLALAPHTVASQHPTERAAMQAYVDEFLDYLAAEKGYSGNTLAAYRNDLNQFTQRLSAEAGVTSWTEVNQSQIVDYILYMKELEYASSTVARKVAAIKSFFHYLRDEDIVKNDPTLALESPKVKKHLPKAISEEDVERLLAEPTKSDSPKALRDSALLEVLYATGMRVSELVSLNVGDVDLAAGTVYCIGKGRPGTGGADL